MVNVELKESGNSSNKMVGQNYVGTLVVSVPAKIEDLKPFAKLYPLDSEEEYKISADMDIEPGVYKLILNTKDYIEFYPIKLVYKIDPYPTALNQLFTNLLHIGLPPVGMSENSGNPRKNFYESLKGYITKQNVPQPVEVDNKEVLERLANIQSVLKDINERNKKPDLTEFTDDIKRHIEIIKQKPEEIGETIRKSLPESLWKLPKPEDIEFMRKALAEGSSAKIPDTENIMESVRKSLSEDIQKISRPDIVPIVDEIRKVFLQEKKNMSYEPIIAEIRAMKTSDTEKLQKEIDSLKEKLFSLEKEKASITKYLQEAEDYISEIQQI